MDKRLAESLISIIGNIRDWEIILNYLKYEEDLVLNSNRTAAEDKDLRINQGKLQLIHKLKSLRDIVRTELGK